MTAEKVTYTTIGSADDFNPRFESAAEAVQKHFGRTVSSWIGGEAVAATKTVEVTSPSDRRIVVTRSERARTGGSWGT